MMDNRTRCEISKSLIHTKRFSVRLFPSVNKESVFPQNSIKFNYAIAYFSIMAFVVVNVRMPGDGEVGDSDPPPPSKSLLLCRDIFQPILGW